MHFIRSNHSVFFIPFHFIRFICLFKFQICITMKSIPSRLVDTLVYCMRMHELISSLEVKLHTKKGNIQLIFSQWKAICLCATIRHFALQTHFRQNRSDPNFVRKKATSSRLLCSLTPSRGQLVVVAIRHAHTEVEWERLSKIDQNVVWRQPHKFFFGIWVCGCALQLYVFVC